MRTIIGILAGVMAAFTLSLTDEAAAQTAPREGAQRLQMPGARLNQIPRVEPRLAPLPPESMDEVIATLERGRMSYLPCEEILPIDSIRAGWGFLCGHESRTPIIVHLGDHADHADRIARVQVTYVRSLGSPRPLTLIIRPADDAAERYCTMVRSGIAAQVRNDYACAAYEAHLVPEMAGG